MRNEELILHDHVSHTNLDITVVTETWMNDNDDEDCIWFHVSDLNNLKYYHPQKGQERRQSGYHL